MNAIPAIGDRAHHPHARTTVDLIVVRDRLRGNGMARTAYRS
jgi:predicted GNAT superfamily acetyltransferase